MVTFRILGLALALGAVAAQGAIAETAKQQAVAAGASQLTANEIAALIVGNTVTARLGGKEFLFFYGDDNVITGQLVDGGWSDSGYYGITDEDSICLSMTKDEGRLRCMTLFSQDGTTRKFNAKGEATFELVEIKKGKTF